MSYEWMEHKAAYWKERALLAEGGRTPYVPDDRVPQSVVLVVMAFIFLCGLFWGWVIWG